MSILTSSSISTQAILLRIRLNTYLNPVLQTRGCHNLHLTFQEMNRTIGIVFSTNLTETNVVLKTCECTIIWTVEQRHNNMTSGRLKCDYHSVSITRQEFQGYSQHLVYSILTFINFLNRYHVACFTFKPKHFKMPYCSISKDISLMLLFSWWTI